MKKILSSLFVFIFTFSFAFSLTKLSFENGTALSFEPCADGSVRFEAIGNKPLAPVRDFELKRKKSDTEFIKNVEGNYIWENYVLVPTDKGYTLFVDGKELYTSVFTDDGKLLKELRTWKSADSFYGFGQASRSVNLKNQSFTIYNESKYGDHAYIFIPFYVTNEATSVFYNANGRDKIYFQDGEDSELYRSEYHRIECFVRQDVSVKEAVQKFYAETESSCILPKWAYGYIQSKYGYKSSDEVIQLVDDFKKRDIPLSAVVLDLYWFKQMGDIYWTSPDFLDFSKMNEYMEENGVKLITITEPFFTTECKNYEDLKKSGLLCKNQKGKIALWRDWWCLNDKIGGVFNPLGKKASAFMGKKYSQMLDSGIDGFWTDLGEPEKVPADLKYEKYNEQDFHNYYNFYWTKALYKGLKELRPDDRLFILSRSAGVGSGKFNVSVWSGDVSVSWPALKNQIAYGVNTGLSGLAYWGSDVGGFVQPESPEELYIRWQQFGAFTPVYRAHGTGPREPFAYSSKAEEIVTNLIRTREKLIPYIYSTAHQTMQGLPMMRGMFYEDISTPEKYLNSQYMFGDSLLISPVMDEASATTEHTVYLPKGTWFNFFTNEKIVCEDSIEYKMKTTLETLPVFVKEGSIIPQTVDGKSVLYVYPVSGRKNNFTLYDDDGKTESYKSGDYSEIVFSLDGTKLSASVQGKTDYLQNEFYVVLPGKTVQDSHLITLDELESGVELY